MQATMYTVEVSTDGGASWGSPIFTGPQQTAAWEKVSPVDLTQYCGYQINLSWRYVATGQVTPPGSWYLDDILVFGE